MPYQTLILMSLLYGISAFFNRHQASHLVYIKEGDQKGVGRVTLNPMLILILWVYHLPWSWLILILIGLKTFWYYPVIILLISQVLSFILVGIEMKLKLNGALLSLFGIIVIPIALYGVYYLSKGL